MGVDAPSTSSATATVIRPSPRLIIVRAAGWYVALGVAVGVAITLQWIGQRMLGGNYAFAWPAGGVAILIMVARLGWDAVDWSARRYSFDAVAVRSQQGVLARIDARIDHSRVQARWVIKPWRERLVGIGSVAFASAGGGRPEVIWRGVANPYDVLRRAQAAATERGPAIENDTHAPTRSDDHRPLVIGLAGGIGSGKSTVARAFAELGCVVSDSDQEARSALDRSDVRDTLVGWWGDRILNDDGRVDRKAVGGIVFADEHERARLESLVHPIIRRSRETLIDQARTAGAPAVIVDAPLLFEVGLDRECDTVVFVDTDRQTRLARVRETRGWDEGELRRRENAQLPLEEKRDRSDHVVVNSGAPDDLRRRVRSLLGQLTGRSA